MKLPAIECYENDTYALYESYQGQTTLRGHNHKTEYCTLLPNGVIIIDRGFMWRNPRSRVHTLIPSAIRHCLKRMIADGYLPKCALGKVRETYNVEVRQWKDGQSGRRLARIEAA